MALCKSTVYKVYTVVIEDVMLNVKDIFTDEGVDEQVLHELKTLWDAKLTASKAVDTNPETVEPGKNKKADSATNNTHGVKREPLGAGTKAVPQQFPKTEGNIQQQVPNTAVGVIPTGMEDKMIPIQITLPTQPTVNSGTRVLTIHVPQSALNGPQLHTLLTGPVITATMGLPTSLASSLLQQHVNAALQSQQQQQQQHQMAMNKIVMPQMDGAGDEAGKVIMNEASTSGTTSKHRKSKKSSKTPVIEIIFPGVDGATDTSDEEEEGSEDDGSDDEIDEEKEDDEGELDPDGAPEEEPLNSEDDVTDEEPTDLFDTDNVVVCQYDKITRSRNKWKFYLKDGIMNVEGEDFVFQKANGDAEW